MNNFLTKYPSKELAKKSIDLNLIHSIFHSPDFKLTLEEFNLLRNIQPIWFDLRITDKSKFIQTVGKYARKGTKGVAGVYVFTNKNSGFSYVGSSISLVNRLTTGYFSTALATRKINIAIADLGLHSFYLNLYILPVELLEKKTFSGENAKISKKSYSSFRTNISSRT